MKGIGAMPMTHHVMAATPHYLATAVGLDMLRRGGNAFDAAISISAALGVVLPHMTGIGGDAFFMSYHASSGRLSGLNGSGKAGGEAAPARYRSLGLESIPQRGPLSAITVPGMVDAWWEVWRRYGSLPWSDLIDPAVQYAECGCPIVHGLYGWMRANEELIAKDEGLARVYMPDGKLLEVGDRLVQTELAASLRAVQRNGRDEFYEGELAGRIVSSLERAGGLLRQDDFARHRSEWVDPISTIYRGCEVYQMPPNSQGFSLLMMLNMLERFDMRDIPRLSPDFYHLAVEAVKRAFRDRDRYLSDPNFVDIPLDRLLSGSYAEELAAHIRSFGSALSCDSYAMGQDTAYAAVVDGEGNAVSFIQSLYFDFGSGYTAGDTGVILHNRGSYFSLDASRANCLAPGKRPFHTLMPAIVCQDGKPSLLLGTQGGEGQPQTQLSILTGILDYGCSPLEALALPRWVYGRTWGEDSDALRIEHRVSDALLLELKRRGHRVEPVQPWDAMMGHAQCIQIDRQRGLLLGAADPRGDGMANGW